MMVARPEDAQPWRTSMGYEEVRPRKGNEMRKEKEEA